MNSILDADIRNFFGSVSQTWLARFLEHRIGDKRIIRLIQKWLRAGILEDGIVTVDDRATGHLNGSAELFAQFFEPVQCDHISAPSRSVVREVPERARRQPSGSSV